MSRTSSASRCSDRGVKPTRSQNKAVTRRRSSPRVSVLTAAGGASTDAVWGAPHSSQKRMPTRFSAPHELQRGANDDPHRPQNRLPLGTDSPQAEQKIVAESNAASCYVDRRACQARCPTGGHTITGSRSATPDFAMLGRERNGVFFNENDSD